MATIKCYIRAQWLLKLSQIQLQLKEQNIQTFIGFYFQSDIFVSAFAEFGLLNTWNGLCVIGSGLAALILVQI